MIIVLAQMEKKGKTYNKSRSDQHNTFDTFFYGNNPFPEQYCDQKAPRKRRHEQQVHNKSKTTSTKYHSEGVFSNHFKQPFMIHIIKPKPKNQNLEDYMKQCFLQYVSN
eukprot:GFUD01076857.1.p1 GENE.GFUD01076857.1~~GFUD01076857.1.p1  ORF type:complete len:109 (-),score=2.60 GFUD01076857.1:868-1194(-)